MRIRLRSASLPPRRCRQGRTVRALPGRARAHVGGRRRGRRGARRSEGLRSRACQASSASRPPGLRAVARLANAARRSAGNIAPKRLITTSNAATSNRCTWASAHSYCTLARPARLVRTAASSSMRWSMSTPSMNPADASSPASRDDWPVPQPTSSTRSVAGQMPLVEERLPCGSPGRCRTCRRRGPSGRPRPPRRRPSPCS